MVSRIELFLLDSLVDNKLDKTKGFRKGRIVIYLFIAPILAPQWLLAGPVSPRSFKFQAQDKHPVLPISHIGVRVRNVDAPDETRSLIFTC